MKNKILNLTNKGLEEYMNKVQVKIQDFKTTQRQRNDLTKTAFKCFDKKLITASEYLTILRKNGTKSF